MKALKYINNALLTINNIVATRGNIKYAYDCKIPNFKSTKTLLINFY